MNKSHDRIQQELYVYLWNKYPQTRGCCWHTPNEFSQDDYFKNRVLGVIGKQNWLSKLIDECKTRNIIFMKRRKDIGVLKGVTDLVFHYKGILYMFDIKIGTDKLSDAQKDFIKANEAQGGKFFKIGSVEQGKGIIDKIMTEVSC